MLTCWANGFSTWRFIIIPSSCHEFPCDACMLHYQKFSAGLDIYSSVRGWFFVLISFSRWLGYLVRCFWPQVASLTSSCHTLLIHEFWRVYMGVSLFCFFFFFFSRSWGLWCCPQTSLGCWEKCLKSTKSVADPSVWSGPRVLPPESCSTDLFHFCKA